jgi:hypothetical protein
LPPTVSHLLLQALFMQISGMSFTVTKPCSLCLFRVLLDTCPFCFLQYAALPNCCNCSLLYYLEFACVVSLPHSPVERAIL